MFLVGLTGGIGSGKSTVAEMLAAHGAVIVDADGFSREALAPETPELQAVFAAFGDRVRAGDGSLDRRALADAVFSDPKQLRTLEGIVHPVVRQEIASHVDRFRDTERVVVIDSPLLIEMGQHEDVDLVVVVTAPEQTQVERMVRGRGFEEDDVRRRLAAQLPLETKAERADVVLDNHGSLRDLQGQVDRLWDQLRTRAAARG